MTPSQVVADPHGEEARLRRLEPRGPVASILRFLAHKRVAVIDYPDGRLSIKYEGRDLPYKIFDKLQKVDQAAIVENKRLKFWPTSLNGKRRSNRKRDPRRSRAAVGKPSGISSSRYELVVPIAPSICGSTGRLAPCTSVSNSSGAYASQRKW